MATLFSSPGSSSGLPRLASQLDAEGGRIYRSGGGRMIGRNATTRMRRISRVTVAVCRLCVVALACSGCYHKVVLQEPMVWQANDRQPIPEPQEETEGQWALWDGT